MIVTAIDAGFYPALVALVNSIRRHSPTTPVACLTYGDEELARRVEALGVEVRHNVDINAHLPEGEGTPAGCRPMYARLLARLLYGDCIWLDADQVVLTDLRKLLAFEFDEPVAAVEWFEIQRGVVGLTAPLGHGVYSGRPRCELFNEIRAGRPEIAVRVRVGHQTFIRPEQVHPLPRDIQRIEKCYQKGDKGLIGNR